MQVKSFVQKSEDKEKFYSLIKAFKTQNFDRFYLNSSSTHFPHTNRCPLMDGIHQFQVNCSFNCSANRCLMKSLMFLRRPHALAASGTHEHRKLFHGVKFRFRTPSCDVIICRTAAICHRLTPRLENQSLGPALYTVSLCLRKKSQNSCFCDGVDVSDGDSDLLGIFTV